MMFYRLHVFLLLLLTLPHALAVELPGIPEFIDEMVAKHKFNRDELTNAFQHAELRQSVIDAINSPATAKPWVDYRAIFVNDNNVREGLEFWRMHARTLLRAERKYGVPESIIVALLGVETHFGQHMGKFRTLDALTTLAFDYPRRADFFRNELEQYLLLSRDQDFDLMAVDGSYAGAMGIPQFMPSSYLKYAVDFDHDGKIDILHDPIDAIGSVANYFKQFGWKRREPVTEQVTVSPDSCVGSLLEPRTVAAWKSAGVMPENRVAAGNSARLMDFDVADGKEFWLAFNNFDVITRYNNSDFYAMSVYQLSEALRKARRNLTAK
jgi:membrane-bound lytic murein transglycosylase B